MQQIIENVILTLLVIEVALKTIKLVYIGRGENVHGSQHDSSNIVQTSRSTVFGKVVEIVLHFQERQRSSCFLRSA